jgi:digeranylgeranylglycerophospholipid reductase
MEKIKTDILIVGAGPAGSTTAEYAALGGAEVLVLERRPEIGVPVRCGEFMPDPHELKAIFPKAEEVDALFDLPGNLHVLDTDIIRIYSPKLNSWDVPFSGYTTDRDHFDQFLADKARGAGAKFMLGQRVIEVKRGLARTDSLEIEAKLIVGADGPLSTVGKSFGLKRSTDLCPAVTVQAKGDFEPISEMYFGSIAPGGYAWVIPKKGSANVGLGVARKFARMDVGEYFDKFVDFKKIKAPQPAGKVVPMSGPIPKATADGCMLVGDAAGQVMAVNGGGIPIAMLCGRFAGQVAAKHVKSGAALEEYENLCKRQIYPPLKTAVRTKHLANTCFGSTWRLETAMKLLGQRRINKLIRCKPVLP